MFMSLIPPPLPRAVTALAGRLPNKKPPNPWIRTGAALTHSVLRDFSAFPPSAADYAIPPRKAPKPFRVSGLRSSVIQMAPPITNRPRNESGRRMTSSPRSVCASPRKCWLASATAVLLATSIRVRRGRIFHSPQDDQTLRSSLCLFSA